MQHARPSENGSARCIEFQTLPLIFTNVKTHKILFVCLGNICRSPTAEYILRHRAREASMGNAVITASAGASGQHDGENVHEGMRRVLKRHGIDPSGFTSSKIRPSDAEYFDYIIVVDDNNLRETEKQLGFHPGRIFRLTDLIPDSGCNYVPDPWCTGDFDEICHLADAGSLALLKKLKQAQTGWNGKRPSERVPAKAMLSW